MVEEVAGVESRPLNANTAFLLIHGFCAAPDELSSVAQFLTENGFASFSVQVAGHNETPEALAATTWRNWYTSVVKGLERVRTWNPEHIIVLGFSMGGALAIKLASEMEDIEGMILISPAMKLDSRAATFLPILKRIMKYRSVDLESIPKTYGYDLSRTKYDREPLESIHQLVKLIRESNKVASKVTQPTLIIQGTADKTISPESGKITFDLISSLVKELKLIEGAPHVIPCHPLRAEAYKYILPFIDKVVRK